jgi:DNA-binding NarL/FixJ family response regulator
MSTNSLGVLIVEDYAAWRRFVRSILKSHSESCIIHEISDGLEAVQRAAEIEPDLIIMDIGLPKINGIEAARRIRKFLTKTKILFLSQESSPEVVHEALHTGEGYVAKTDAGRDLLTAINAVLRGEQFLSGRFAGSDLLQVGASVD